MGFVAVLALSGCGGTRTEPTSFTARVQAICDRANGRVREVPVPVPQKTNPYDRLKALVDIFGDEHDELAALHVTAAQRARLAPLIAGLHDLSNQLYVMQGTVISPSPRLASNGFRDLNVSGQRVLGRVESAAHAFAAGCVPDPHAASVVVIHLAY